MAENLNLALRILDPAPHASGDGSPSAAVIYLSTTCSYLKGGAEPTLSDACTSLSELEREVARLKAECDAILEEARPHFARAGGASGRMPTVGSGAERPVESPGKTAFEIDRGLRVEDRMTRDVRTVRRNDKLSLMDELMKAGGFRHVVVVDDDEPDKIAGVVTDRDVFYGALAWSLGHGRAAHDRLLSTTPVKEVMHAEVTTVTPDTPLADAAAIMLERRIGCLPVEKDKRLVGILTEGDFLAALTEAKVAAPSA